MAAGSIVSDVAAHDTSVEPGGFGGEQKRGFVSGQADVESGFGGASTAEAVVRQAREGPYM